jgi:signal transduction histidine kinase
VLELVIAQPTTSLLATLAHLRWLLALTWVLSVLGCAGIIGGLVHRGLRPLRQLGAQIEGLDEAGLDRRLAIPDAPAELLPIVGQLNALLDRLRAAFERERAFSGFAAHELRTPLAGLRATLEVALSRERRPEDHRTAEEQCLEITTRMQSMVETLLDLARPAAAASDEEALPLESLLESCWGSHAELVRERGLTLQADGVAGVTVQADHRYLQRILENLLENAASYADADTTIRVQAEIAGDRVHLEISNRATAASAEVAERAFDAFWRADRSRTGTGLHAGLGLALCRKLATQLDATIAATYVDSVFTVTVGGLPAATSRA